MIFLLGCMSKLAFNRFYEDTKAPQRKSIFSISFSFRRFPHFFKIFFFVFDQPGFSIKFEIYVKHENCNFKLLSIKNSLSLSFELEVVKIIANSLLVLPFFQHLHVESHYCRPPLLHCSNFSLKASGKWKEESYNSLNMRSCWIMTLRKSLEISIQNNCML